MSKQDKTVIQYKELVRRIAASDPSLSTRGVDKVFKALKQIVLEFDEAEGSTIDIGIGKVTRVHRKGRTYTAPTGEKVTTKNRIITDFNVSKKVLDETTVTVKGGK